MSFAQHPPKNITRPLLLTVLSGILSGVLLFFVGLHVFFPNNHTTTNVVDNILQVGDIFPGLSGFGTSRVILVMGVDMPGRGMNQNHHFDGVRTDTIMLVRLDSGRHEINIVSLPRDSKVYLANSGGVAKLNAAFAFGGIDLAKATIEESFGVHVDNYIVANLAGVREAVDAVGGVDIYIDQPMRYRDRTAKLDINLERGLNHLDGVEAEGFMRFRHDALGDIGRIRRQQAFIQAFSKKMKGVTALFHLKPLLDVKNKFLLTDMNDADLSRLALFAQDIKPDQINAATLPGYPGYSDGISYWLINREAAEQVLNRLIIGLTATNTMVHPTDEGPSIGLLYTKTQKDRIEPLQAELSDAGYHIGCAVQIKPTRSQFVTHTADSSATARKLLSRLKRYNKRFSDVQLIFSPHGSTFESNQCGRTSYTIILGDDLGSPST
ncbi:MAG: LCP family protein [Cyanobacteria bacterium HKST-UBA04]|nr:LCP family protein [Cyanobacteria bacterium HKST-UBA04]MCA9841921.1 LCP family protein [Cyanobacteria bacterium HKST-UBA03]